MYTFSNILKKYLSIFYRHIEILCFGVIKCKLAIPKQIEIRPFVFP